MSILGTKKNAKKEVGALKETVVAKPVEKANTRTISSAASVLLKPRITEKSGMASQELNAYTFEVSRKASKNEVSKAIKELYKVVPLKINMINLPRKKLFSRGKKGYKAGARKAVVYLKKDNKIEFI